MSDIGGLTPEQRKRLAQLENRPRHAAARSRLTATMVSSLAVVGLVGAMLGTEAPTASANAATGVRAASTQPSQPSVLLMLPDGRLIEVPKSAVPSLNGSPALPNSLVRLPRSHGSR